MRQPALIFDFGNVIAYFDFKRATTTLGDKLGLSGRELWERLRSLGFAEELRQYECGQISAVDFSTRITRLIEIEITHDEFAAAWTNIFTPNETIIPLIQNLKEHGYPLLLGSNTNDLHAAYFRKQFATTLHQFDHFVFSYEVGHVKPAIEFFLACAKAANLPPEDCIFIDDLEANIAGARAAGLVGIVFETTNQLIEDLKKEGIDTHSTHSSSSKKY